MPMMIDRPDCERAHGIQSGVCGDPDCGLHVIAERRDGSAICEIVLSRAQIINLLAYIHDQGLDLPR